MGLPKPEHGELWGVGDLIAHIERNWDDPLFKLGTVYPWIVQAKTYLQKRRITQSRVFINEFSLG